MKLKSQHFVLIALVVCLAILIIPSIDLGNLNKLEAGKLDYENLAGDTVAYLAKRNHAGEMTYAELFRKMSIFQVVFLVAEIAIAALAFVFGLNDKKFPLSGLLLIVLSCAQINAMGQSNLFMIISLLPVVLSVIYLITRKIDKVRKKHE